MQGSTSKMGVRIDEYSYTCRLEMATLQLFTATTESR